MPANFNPGWYDEYLHDGGDSGDPTRMYWTCAGCDEVRHKGDAEQPATDVGKHDLPWVNNDAGVLCEACAERLTEYDEDDDQPALGFSLNAMLHGPLYGE